MSIIKGRIKKIALLFLILFALVAVFYIAFVICGNSEIKIKPPKILEPILSTQKAEASPPAKTIEICFDDGPRPYALKEILSVLEKYKAQGNFFVLGCNVPANKELIKKISDAGHGIENHTWGHPNLKKLYKEKGSEAIKSEIRRTGDIILKTTGRKPKFFRPPFWEIDKSIEKIVADEGYKVMKINDPDINTMDYDDFAKKHPPETLINRVKSQIAIREKQKIFNHVLVFHELTITAKALDILIPYFEEQGYLFVRLDQFPK